MKLIEKTMRFILIVIFTVAISPSLVRSSVLVKDLQEIVDINSGTGNIPGVNKVQSWTEERLRKLGFEVELITNPLGEEKSGKLLLATMKGEDPRFITLIVHSDTVFEPSTEIQKFKISEDGKRATGPGVIDAKGGIIVALNGLQQYLKDRGLSKYSLRFISSPSEEVGSIGFLDLFYKLAGDSWVVLSFEPALDDGSVILSRRGNRWYHIKVNGKEAHSGRSHQEGINACHELSEKLRSISKLTDYKRDVTVSIGHMKGGQDKFNIVCGSAEAKIDTRFADLKNRDLLHKKIIQIINDTTVRSFDKNVSAQTTFELVDDCPPFSISEKSKPFLNKYLKIISDIEGKKVIAKPSGATADGNYFSREGSIIIDGLGVVGGKMHTNEEYVILSSLEMRAAALGIFLRDL